MVTCAVASALTACTDIGTRGPPGCAVANTSLFPGVMARVPPWTGTWTGGVDSSSAVMTAGVVARTGSVFHGCWAMRSSEVSKVCGCWPGPGTLAAWLPWAMVTVVTLAGLACRV